MLLDHLRAARASGAERGWTLSFNRARLYGFPFRLDLDLQDARIADPSGWAVEAPHLKAEAYLFAPANWVAVAPEGVVITRRSAGPLIVRGKALRASLSQWGARPPRLSVEGLDVTFVTPPGARPFALVSASGFHLHTRAGPNDQGAIYIGIEGGRARSSGTLDDIAGGKPVAITLDALWSHASALSGGAWPVRVKNWAEAGGDLTTRHLEIIAGPASIWAAPGIFSVDRDGRLLGNLSVTLGRTRQILSAMTLNGKLPAETARAAETAAGPPGPASVVLPLYFQAGRTTLGPVALGPSPRVF